MIHLYFHGGSGNHGCEAIVRSTARMFKEKLVLHTSNVESDLKYNLDNIVTIEEDAFQMLSKKTFEYYLFAIHHKLTGSDYLYTRFTHDRLFSNVNKKDIYMSIGGDNYCYNGTDILCHYNQCIQKNGAKTVLWGCSVESDVVKNSQVAEDLARYDLITARESISYEALKTVNPNTVLVSDPAFTLEAKEASLPKGWINGAMIGINASPLVIKDGKEGVVYKAYKKLIQRILEVTDCSIALIPHVTLPTSDDRQVLKSLFDEFQNTERIILLDDYDCMELKGYIARCRMFIGARTHATIAAYSSCVPTLVLGYSVKSKGIAKDIFGTDQDYVLSVQNMLSEDMLADGFDWLLNNEDVIRSHLREVMPEYINRAYLGIQKIKHLTEGRLK